MADRRRRFAALQGFLAVAAVLALRLTPVNASAGGVLPHAHLLIDGADGTFDHHEVGERHHDSERRHSQGNHTLTTSAGSTHADWPSEANAGLVGDAVRRSARPPGDLPVVKHVSVFATAAAAPVADLLALLFAPAEAYMVLV